ncbi:MFS general substrate transporter [Pseudohyphozyma bogoriensis]|nr:MFS general substrate transporter [Pseudohyphozyma bogoriensis]
MATTATEQTPLLGGSSTPKVAFANEEEYREAVVESAFHFQDVNASAFVLPGPDAVGEIEEESQAPAEPHLRPDINIILLGMFSGCFLAALDSTIVATCLSVIGTEFHAANSISWLGTSYMMTQTAAQPLYGKCSQIFGRRVTTMFSSAVFLLGSLACGLATTYPQLLAARAVAGVGGAGLTVMMAIVTSDLIPLRSRGIYQGYGNLVYNLGAAAGGPLGGYLGDSVGWRWAFLIQVPICVLHFAMAWWKVENSFDPTFQPGHDMMARIKRVDFLGSILLVLGVAASLVGLALGGNEYPWSAPIVWVSLIGGILVLVIFVLVETYVAAEPLLAPELLFTRTPGFVSLTNFFASMAQLAILYSVPLWFSVVKGLSNSNAGLHLIPSVISTSASSLISGWIMGKTGYYRLMLAITAFINFCGPLIMIFWDRITTPDWVFWVTMSPGGIGFGAIITITLVALISAVPPESMAAATGCSYLFRATGSVLGISLSTAILQNTLQTELVKVIKGPDADEVIKNIRLDMNYVNSMIPEVQKLVIDSYEAAYHYVFIAITAMGVAAFICALFIKHHELPSRLDRKK